MPANAGESVQRRRTLFFVRVTTGFLLSAWMVTVGKCDNCPANVNDDIQRCVTPVAQFAEALGVDVSLRGSALANDRLLPNMGSEVFRELCARITAFTQCTRNARQQCPTHITLALVNASYGYLCNEAYDTFKKNAACLMKLDQEPTVRMCHDRTMNTIRNVSRDTKTSLAQKLAVMCQALNYFAVCVEKPISTGCGLTAWAVIERVLRDTTRTLVPTCVFGAVSASAFTELPSGALQKYLNDAQDHNASSTPKITGEKLEAVAAGIIYDGTRDDNDQSAENAATRLERTCDTLTLVLFMAAATAMLLDKNTLLYLLIISYCLCLCNLVQ